MARAPGYATREQVKAAVDVKNSVRANAQIDRAIADASRSADRLCRRTFYPRYATARFDWPDEDRPTPWVLWLGGDSELIQLTGLSAGGTTIALGSVLLYPSSGPPYTRLELNRSTIAGFDVSATPQQVIAVTGLMGYADDQDPAGQVANSGGLTDSGTTLEVADGSLVDVGHVLTCGTERMIVTERGPLTTGLTITANLTSAMNAITLTLSGTTLAPNPGEMILVDGERMQVVDRIGATAFVQRAVDGTVLATHTSGATVYAYRSLTVERGAVGSTAAAHTAAAALTAYRPPAAVNGLVVADALNQIAQENSAYARVVGAGEGQREARGAGLAQKRERVRTELGRRVRMGAV